MFRLLMRSASILLLASATVASAQTLASNLESKLAGKLLYLRIPDPGTKLRFGANGTAVKHSNNGLSSLDGLLRVREVEMNDRELTIKGERFAIVWDPKTRRPEYTDINQSVNVSLALPDGRTTTEAQLAPIFYKAFLSVKEELQNACTKPEQEVFAEKMGSVGIQTDKKTGILIGLALLEPSPTLCFPSGERVLGPGKGMHPPKLIKEVDPQYPTNEESRRVEGTAVYLVALDQSGVPRDALMVQSADPRLNYSGLEVLRKWRFKPAELNGKPTSCAVNVRVNFKLR